MSCPDDGGIAFRHAQYNPSIIPPDFRKELFSPKAEREKKIISKAPNKDDQPPLVPSKAFGAWAQIDGNAPLWSVSHVFCNGLIDILSPFKIVLVQYEYLCFGSE